MTAGSENPSSTRRYANEKTPAGSRSIEEQAEALPHNTARFSSAIPQTKLRYALTDAGHPISAAVRSTAEETFSSFFSLELAEGKAEGGRLIECAVSNFPS